MNKHLYLILLYIVSIPLLFSGKTYAQTCTPLAEGCSSIDLSNSYFNSSNPNTIEYDNIVSAFHSTVAREANGKVIVWGEYMSNSGTSHVLTPQELNSTNYPALTGDILKFTGGSRNGDALYACQQFVVLTTTGLFAWGGEGYLIDTAITTSSTFQKISVGGKADGLPTGVNPGDVKMLFGSWRILGLVTCSGDVWTLVNSDPVSDGNAAYGDNSTYSLANNKIWHRVKQNASTNLSNVVAIRGGGCYTSSGGENKYNFMALKADGTVWTWGNHTYLGNSTAAATRYYATQMTLPAGVTPKMISMKGVGTYGSTSYYILSTDGYVYSLGNNDRKQLGDFSIIPERTAWVRVRKSSTGADYLNNIVWISVSEHDGDYFASVNTIGADGSLWAWGDDSYRMIGGPGGSTYYINPTQYPGGLLGTEKILAVETGGHTTIIIKSCDGQYGYVGHHINGSMGDGSAITGTETTYNFSATATMDLCAAPALAQITSLDTSFVCSGSVISGNYITGIFNVLSANASIDSSSGIVNLIGAGDISIRFSFGDTSCPSYDTAIFRQRDFGNLDTAKYPLAYARTAASNQAWLGIDIATGDCTTETSDPADGLQISKAGIALAGAGTASSPWVLSGALGDSVTMKVTVNGSGSPKPVYWALWYDSNGDGDFTDANDLFYTGNTVHGSPVTDSFKLALPFAMPAAGIDSARIRLTATAISTVFSKAMNGNVQLSNGEVEDFYIVYSSTPLPIHFGSFNVRKEDSKALLQWTTVSEIDNKGFAIERSTDGKNWQELGFLNPETPNSHSLKEYRYYDHLPEEGRNLYRIRQVSYQGGNNYTPVQQLFFSHTGGVEIHPNPAKETLFINGLEGAEQIRIYDAFGRLVETAQAESPQVILQLSDLNAGLFYIHILHLNGRFIAQKLMINR